MIKMKKMCFVFLIFLVGCSKEINCSKNDILVKIKGNDNINEVIIEKNFDNLEEAGNYCTLLKLSDISVECLDNKIIYNNYINFLNREFVYTRELIDYLESDNYLCK